MMAMKCRPRISPRSSCSRMMRAMPNARSRQTVATDYAEQVVHGCTVANIRADLWRAESAIEWRCGESSPTPVSTRHSSCRRSPG